MIKNKELLSKCPTMNPIKIGEIGADLAPKYISSISSLLRVIKMGNWKCSLEACM